MPLLFYLFSSQIFLFSFIPYNSIHFTLSHSANTLMHFLFAIIDKIIYHVA